VLLLDEPFGALDAKVRKELRRWLRRLHDEIHVTSIFVTHDQEEALEVADRVVLMNHGRVEQQGTPEEVYDRPANPFVFSFLGHVNLFHGRAHAGQLHVGETALEMPEHAGASDAPAVGFARPHELEVERYSPGQPGISAVLERALVVGPSARLELRQEGSDNLIDAEISTERFRSLRLRTGERLLVRPQKMRVFLKEETAAAGSDYII
jgi:sulfate transport system ATP-binding protein